jgi:regulator of sirC expression with transglutaminase-like and TPR domain
MSLPSFAELAVEPDATMDYLALAMAAEFRPVDARVAIARLDDLGAELSRAAANTSGSAAELTAACARVLATAHGFSGDRTRYDHPDNSMLDIVLKRRRGLPILLSVVYIEVARRAGIPLAGVGLRGHFVVGHLASGSPILVDPFADGRIIPANTALGNVRAWGPHEIALRMLNNLLASYQRRGDLTRAIRAARLRLDLPAEGSLRATLRVELQALQARLN